MHSMVRYKVDIDRYIGLKKRVGRRILLLTINQYVKVKSLEEAYELNQKRANRVLGGMMWLRMSKGRAMTAIDLSDLGLDKIEEREDAFSIGCMCTLREMETHEGLHEYFDGAIKECVRHIVGVQFRNSATVGGSIFGRFGFSDVLTCFLALDTCVELYKGGIVSLKEFVDMPRDNDILVRILIKKDGRKVKYLSERMTKTDFPMIAAAVAVKEEKVYCAVGARPMKAMLVEDVLPQKDAIDMFAQKMKEKFTYGSNMRGSAEYRKHLAGVCIRRALTELLKETK